MTQVTRSMGIQIVRGVPAGRACHGRYGQRAMRDVTVPMRDGVLLSMDIFRPTAAGKFPVILLRTPYNKVKYGARPLFDTLVRSGYVVAVQDCRGRFNSDGFFDPYRQEHTDGYDSIEWLAAQDWCDGNVGMVGSSYEGQTQWFAASQAPKALRAIVPIASPPGNPFLNEPFYGGVMILATPEWAFSMGRRSELRPGLSGLYTQEQSYLEEMPLSRLAGAAGVHSSYWNEWLRHPTHDQYWRSHGYEELWKCITVPALNITGWWDMNFIGAPRNFLGMRQNGGSRVSREEQRLVIGPWAHWANRSITLNGVDFGPNAITDLDAYTLRFFDHWVRGEAHNGLEDDRRVHVFVLGSNEWWQTDEWPLPGTQFAEFYFQSGGRANSHRGDGGLSRECAAGAPFDQYESDPLDPVRVFWSMHEGPVDDRAVSSRPDVLCYTSDALEEPLDVVGPVKAILYGSSSAKDCDWHVRLVDVFPNGAARFLCHGVIRARFRHGFDRTVFLDPGRIDVFQVDMTATGVRFLSGHRIRVEIASTWFPRFERNPQTDAANWMTDARPATVAQQRIYHNSQYPSCVVLPLIPAMSGEP